MAVVIMSEDVSLNDYIMCTQYPTMVSLKFVVLLSSLILARVA